MTENLTLVVNNPTPRNAEKLEDKLSKTLSTRDVVQRIALACEEVKGQETTVLDVHSLSDIADYFVIVSGRSDRQVQGITNRIVEELVRLNIKPLAVEGYTEGQWVIVDCGEIVVHIFYEQKRALYDIESLWMQAKRLYARDVA
jgi:ribosome-associated protein